ncbi:MAG: 2-hydroxyacyl-CoA dehydratase, partial [Deltaproteobacteria bacterium]|nr:2-hydroxyacyl-CoA dehydratase [Candidatus Desulfobacula maris]
REITNADLEGSIKKFNLIRKNLSKIYALQSQRPGIIKGADLYAIVKGSMVMDRDEVADLLPAIVANLEKIDVPQKSVKRIVVSGSICDSPDIYTAMEAAGGVIVGDDLCTGQRWFEGEILDDENPINAIATRLLDRIICPAKHFSPTARGENMVSLAKKNRADGVIFMLLKFCDPHAFDYPYLKEFLDKEGIKNMLIEMDDQQQNSGQLTTRFETFIHMI